MREEYEQRQAELGDAVFFTVTSFILYVVFFWGHHVILHLVVYSGRVSTLQKYKATLALRHFTRNFPLRFTNTYRILL